VLYTYCSNITYCLVFIKCKIKKIYAYLEETVLGMVCLNGYRPMGYKEFMEYTLLLCILHKQRTVLFFDMAVLRTYCIKGSSHTATQVDQYISALINTQVNISQVHLHSKQIYRTFMLILQ